MDVVAYPPEPDVDALKSQSSVHLPIPNPFKALANKSVESLGLLSEDKDKPTRPFDRVILGKEGDFGALALHNRVNGIQLQPTASGLRGLVWSDTELSVSAPYSHHFRILSLDTFPGLRVQRRFSPKSIFSTCGICQGRSVEGSRNIYPTILSASGPAAGMPIRIHFIFPRTAQRNIP